MIYFGLKTVLKITRVYKNHQKSRVTGVRAYKKLLSQLARTCSQNCTKIQRHSINFSVRKLCQYMTKS